MAARSGKMLWLRHSRTQAIALFSYRISGTGGNLGSESLQKLVDGRDTNTCQQSLWLAGNAVDSAIADFKKVSAVVIKQSTVVIKLGSLTSRIVCNCRLAS